MNGITAYLAFDQIDDSYITESALPEPTGGVILPPPTAKGTRRRFTAIVAAVVAATLLLTAGLVAIALRADWFTPPADTTDTDETPTDTEPVTEAYELLGPEDADMIEILKKAPPPAPEFQISEDATVVGMTFTRIPITDGQGTRNAVVRFTLYEDRRGRDLFTDVLDTDGSVMASYVHALNDDLFLLLQNTEDETEITLITLTASAFQGVGSFYCSPVAFKWCFPCDEEPDVNRVEGNLCEGGYWYSGELKLPMSPSAVTGLTQRLSAYWNDLTLASLDAPGGYHALMDGMSDTKAPHVYSRSESELSRAAAEAVFAIPFETLMDKLCEGMNLSAGTYVPPVDENGNEITIPSPNYDPYPDEVAAKAPAMAPDLPDHAVLMGTTVCYTRVTSNQYNDKAKYVSRIALYKDGRDPFLRYLYMDVLNQNGQVLATYLKETRGVIALFQSVENPSALVLWEITATVNDKGKLQLDGLYSEIFWTDMFDSPVLHLYDTPRSVSTYNGSWVYAMPLLDPAEADVEWYWKAHAHSIRKAHGNAIENLMERNSSKGYRILVNGLTDPCEPTVCPSSLVSTEGYLDYYAYTQDTEEKLHAAFYYLMEYLGYEVPALPEKPTEPELPNAEAILWSAQPMTPDLPATIMLDGETYVYTPVSRGGRTVYAVCRVAVYRNPDDPHTQYLYLDVLNSDGSILASYTKELKGLFGLIQDRNTMEHLMLCTAVPTEENGIPGMAFTTLALTWTDTDPVTGHVSDTPTLFESPVEEASWSMEAEPELLEKEGAHAYWNNRYDNWMPKWSGCLRYWEDISDNKNCIMPAGNLTCAEIMRQGEDDFLVVNTVENGFDPENVFDSLTHESRMWTWMFGYCMDTLGYSAE